MKHPLYLVYGVAILALGVTAELRGWLTPSPNEARVESPRSVRENPGAYRPIYRGVGGRYMRGK